MIPDDARQIAHTKSIYSRAEVKVFDRLVPPNLEREYYIYIHEQLKNNSYEWGPLNMDCLKELKNTLNDVVDERIR